MPQDPSFLHCKKVEYSPDWSVEWLKSCQVDTDLILDPVFESFFQGATTNFNIHLNQRLRQDRFIKGLIKGLVQVEFTVNGKTFLFPDFDNIFSRPESVKNWWFLPPQFNGEDIYQSEEDINTWWNNFQKIYDSSILAKVEAKKIQLLFLELSKTNFLVEYLFDKLTIPPDTIYLVDDEKDLMYPDRYCCQFFCNNNIEKSWQLWLLREATIRYYYTIFSPTLLEENNSRKIRRLSNRFPEYASADRHLAKFKEDLYSNCDREYVDKFFNAQSIKLKTEAQAIRRPSGELAPLDFYQCRVCGVMCIPTPALKIVEDGRGRGRSRSRQTCFAPECERALDLLGKRLPQNPDDPEGGNIQISHL
jgi:hypothetical protein